MTRLLLFLIFFVMFAGDNIGLNVGLAPGLSVKNAFLYLILVSIAIESALKRNRSIELMSVILPYSMLFLYAMFTWTFILLLRWYPGYSMISTLIGLKGSLADHVIVLIVFFYGVLNAKDALALIKALIWTVVIANIVTIVDSLNIPDLGLAGELYQGRIVGFIGEPNQYAAFLDLFLPSSLALVLLGRGFVRLLALLAFAASVLALFMTISRGGLVGLFIGSAIGTFYLRQHISGKTIVASMGGMFVLLVLIVSILFALGFGDMLYERTIGVSTRGNAFDISSGRTSLWGNALAVMFEQPLSLILGYGWGSYRYFPEFTLAPHNTYLKVFFELGFVGLVLMLTALFNIFRIALDGVRHADASAAPFLFAFCFGFPSFLIAIFFVDLTTPWILIWAYIGTSMRLAVSQIRQSNAGAGRVPGRG